MKKCYTNDTTDLVLEIVKSYSSLNSSKGMKVKCNIYVKGKYIVEYNKYYRLFINFFDMNYECDIKGNRRIIC